MKALIPKYLPQNQAQLRRVVESYDNGNHDIAKAVLYAQLPEQYVDEKYRSLVNEIVALLKSK